MRLDQKYTPEIDRVLDQLTMIDYLFHRPTQVINANGQIVSFEWVWTSEEEKEAYELLRARIVKLVKAQEELERRTHNE